MQFNACIDNRFIIDKEDEIAKRAFQFENPSNSLIDRFVLHKISFNILKHQWNWNSCISVLNSVVNQKYLLNSTVKLENACKNFTDISCEIRCKQ